MGESFWQKDSFDHYYTFWTMPIYDIWPSRKFDAPPSIFFSSHQAYLLTLKIGCITWSYYYLVSPPGLTTWSYHLVLPPGLITWSYHLVLPPGLVPWSYSQYFWVNYEKIKNMFWRLMFTGDIQKTIWFFLRILFYDF